jgi:signal transduction histidine kinase
VRPIVALTETTDSIRHAGNLKKTGLSGETDEIGQLGASFDQMVDRLQDTEGKLATAVTDERNRLARDLHDAVSQTLFSASIIAEVLPRLWEKNPEEGRRRLEEIRQLTRGALAEMRTLLFELRPSALADADTSHLMHQLVESLSGRLRIPVDVQIDKDCPLPPDVKVAFYRIAQEALNNIIKHSGATAAKVVLNCRPSGVFLSINDNGTGFDPATGRPGSLGVGIMHDRAAEIGASLIVESKVGAGSTVTVIWNHPKESRNGSGTNDTSFTGG